MSSRHLARTIAMQSLYEWEFNGGPPAALPLILSKNLKEFAHGIKAQDQEFSQEIIDGVVKNKKEIDNLIKKFAPQWPLDKITGVDRNILRIGIFELVMNEKIPAKVAIDEAIEMAKAYGGHASGRFVNGVLGAIFKKMLDEGKVKEIDKTI